MYVLIDLNDSINIGYLDKKPEYFLERFYRRIILSLKSTNGLNENHQLNILLLKTGWKKNNRKKPYTAASGRESYKGAVRSYGEKNLLGCEAFFSFFSLSQPWPRKHVLYTPQAQNPKTTFDPNDSIVLVIMRCVVVHLYSSRTAVRIRPTLFHDGSRPRHSTTITPGCKSADFDVHHID